jgi:hypothetical protein
VQLCLQTAALEINICSESFADDRSFRNIFYETGCAALLVTEDLFLLPDYAENEWLYRLIAAERDLAAGITIEGPWNLEVWETEGLKGDIEKIRKDMEIQGLLGRAELLEKEIETCRRKDEARRKWLGIETLEEEERWLHELKKKFVECDAG